MKETIILIKTQICIKCKIEKDFESFPISSHYRLGRSMECKTCGNDRRKIWRQNNKEKCKKYSDNWKSSEDNLIKHRKAVGNWKRNNADHIKEYKKMYYKKNIQKCKDIQKRSLSNRTPEKIKEQKEKNSITSARHYQKNKKRLAVLRLARDRANANNPYKKLHSNTSRAIRFALKGNKNNMSILKLLGYSSANLKSHLERQFIDGMNWNNYGRGGWEIDHKIPISFFKEYPPSNFIVKILWSLDNLQPLWKVDNLKKTSQNV